MNIEQQVTSLAISQKLKSLGVNQESLFWWNLREKDVDYWIDDKPTYDDECLENKTIQRELGLSFSAFTVAELGKILPAGMQSNKIEQPTNKPFIKKNEWHSWAWNFKHSFFADTEADSRGKMLIYLLEHGIIKSSDL